MPRLILTRQTRCWPRYTPTSSRHNGDTVHLLERGLATSHQVHRHAAYQANAPLLGHFFELPDGGTVEDGLAQFIIEPQQVADGLAAARAAATAVLAAAPQREAKIRAHGRRQL